MTYTQTATMAQVSDFSSLSDLFTNLLPGDSCYIPCAPIAASSDYTRSAPMTLKGSGTYGGGGAVINYSGSGTFLTCNTTGSGLLLEDFRIAGTSSMQNGVFLNGVNNNLNLNRLWIEGGYPTPGSSNALQLQDVYDINITNGTYRYCDVGIYANNQGNNKTVNNMNICNNDLQNNNTGIFWQTGFGGNIIGNDFSGCGIAMDLGNGLAATQQLTGINIGANYCECTTYLRLGHNANANTNVKNINVSGGYLQCSGDYIQLDVCENISITGIQFGGLTAGNYYINISSSAQNTYIDIPQLDPSTVNDNGINTIYAPHLIGAVNVHSSVMQSIANNTEIVVQFDTVDFDKYGEWDATNHGWRCKRVSSTGFKVYGIAQFTGMGNGVDVSAEIAKNGTRIVSCDSYEYGPYPSVSAYYDFPPGSIAVGDLIQFRVVQNSGSSKNLNAGANCTYFSVSAR